MALSGGQNDDGHLKSVTFTINGKSHTVRSNVPLDTSLNTYIRDYAHLKGTKYMCKEGGCGACIVVVTNNLPGTASHSYAVNSCLLKIWSCHGYHITTIEQVDKLTADVEFLNGKSLPHELAMGNGSQCGYCSPGMVMNMCGLIKANLPPKTLTEAKVESGFAGNICRCTGYVTILQAFRKLINKQPIDSDNYIQDIEDGGCAGSCAMIRERRSAEDEDDEDNLVSSFIEFAMPSPTIKLSFSRDQRWYKVYHLNEIFQIFNQLGDDTNYMLINGDTAQGVDPDIFRDQPINTYIDISSVKELRTTKMNPGNANIEVGANVTLTEFMNVLEKAYTENKTYYTYAKELHKHISLVANVPVRNTGTLAGNLMIKYKMLQQGLMFQSDIFLLMATIGATFTISDRSGATAESVPIDKFFSQRHLQSLDFKVITKIILPPIDSSVTKIRTYKIMPRTQNAPAIVNAGFLFTFKPKHPTVVRRATIVYGGINKNFVHAKLTEAALRGQDISLETTLQMAIEKLKLDIPLNDITTTPPPLQSREYRQQLAINLYYKTVLYLNRDQVSPIYRKGADKLEDTRKCVLGHELNLSPSRGLSEPLSKIEAPIQTSGEAQYVNDIPPAPGQLYGALVIAPQGPGTLTPIDKKSIESLPKVINFYQASDIPGYNSMFIPTLYTPEAEELFCSENQVRYAGQPIGIIVAETQDSAIAAARQVNKGVKVTLSGKPLLDINDAIKGGYPSERVLQLPNPPSPNSSHHQNSMEPEKEKEEIKISNGTVIVDSEVNVGSQYHYSMELQTCAVVPIESGQFNVYSATQWPFCVQSAIAHVLGIHENKVNVIVRRVGGAYGCKLTRSAYVACACALAAQLLQRPVRMVLDLETNMKAIGKRTASKCKYQVTVNKETGEIINFDKLETFDDVGITINDPIYGNIPFGIQSGYKIDVLHKLKMYGVKTDKPSSSWCRAPGNIQAILFIESIMNDIAEKIDCDPVKVRLSNIKPNTAFCNFVCDNIKDLCYHEDKNDVIKFNKENRWVKQGLSLVPMQFKVDYGLIYYCTVSICAGDGSISIAHGGCEIGQGVNTKAALAALSVFGLDDLSLIQIKPTNIVYCPNNGLTGASMTSDAITFACLKASKAIKVRLEELKKKLKLSDKLQWRDLVRTAYDHDVNLNATYAWSREAPFDADFGQLRGYNVSCICTAKVEVDILTGQHIVRQVKICEDVGTSYASHIDFGQIQGAFVMGLGYYTSEELVFDQESGELQSNRTWNYDPPGAKDIPERFDVTIVNLNKEGKTEIKGGANGAKATGEPPICLSSSVFFAIKEAVKSARQDAGLPGNFNFDAPATVANNCLLSKTEPTHFKIVA